MQATYVRRMRNKNWAIRIVGSSCRLQEYFQRYNMGFLVVYLLHHHVRLKSRVLFTFQNFRKIFVNGKQPLYSQVHLNSIWTEIHGHRTENVPCM